MTPAKAGDFIKVYSLSRRARIRLPEAFAVGVLDRVLDLIALLVFGAFGAIFLVVNHVGGLLLLWLVGPCFVAGVLVLLLVKREFVTRLARPGLWLLSFFDYSGSLNAMLRQAFGAFYDGLELVRKARRDLVLALISALLASIAISTRSYVFGAALGLNVGWLNFVLLIPLIVLVELLPISVLGIGTREYAVIAIFSFLGVDREQAVSLSLSTFVLSLTPLAVCGYVIAAKEHLRPSDIRSAVAGRDEKAKGVELG